jgi:hypothetical protein
MRPEVRRSARPTGVDMSLRHVPGVADVTTPLDGPEVSPVGL